MSHRSHHSLRAILRSLKQSYLKDNFIGEWGHRKASIDRRFWQKPLKRDSLSAISPLPPYPCIAVAAAATTSSGTC